MGQEQSQITDGAEFQNISQGLQFMNTGKWTNLGFREDSRYGQFKLLHEENGSQVALITKTCQEQNDYSQICLKLQKAKDLNQLNGMVKIIEVCAQNYGNLCSTFYKVIAAYEYFPLTLRDIIKDHKLTVLQFLQQLAPTLAGLYSQSISHGDIAPENILVTDQNALKLNNIQQMTGFNQYRRALIDPECSWYLAPELLHCLSLKELRPRYDAQKADVFSLGLVSLELAINQSIQDIYDFDNFRIKESLKKVNFILQDILNHYLNQLAQKEGIQAQKLVVSMLSANPNTRPAFDELNLTRDLSPLQKQRPSSKRPQLQEQNIIQSPAKQISQNLSPTSQPIINKSFKANNQVEHQENQFSQDPSKKMQQVEPQKIKSVASLPKSQLKRPKVEQNAFKPQSIRKPPTSSVVQLRKK